MNPGIFFITHSLTPLHAGMGQSMGKVDLPVQREKHTTYPCVYATGLKGALRQFCVNDNQLKQYVTQIFGEEDATGGAGGAIFTDLKILLFPVRSSKGAFKWVTCDFVLERFQREFKMTCSNSPPDVKINDSLEPTGDPFDPEKHIILEDFPFAYAPSKNNGNFLGLNFLPNKEIIKVSDELFTYFVNNATQIIARNRLTDQKTSENLWYEETLPAETIMYSFILPGISNTQSLTPLQQHLNQQILQIGGNETVGYGLVKIYVIC